MGQTALLPLRKQACCGNFSPKNPTASAGFEHANLGTRGQRANHYTAEAAVGYLSFRSNSIGAHAFIVCLIFQIKTEVLCGVTPWVVKIHLNPYIMPAVLMELCASVFVSRLKFYML
jgi:hypothetical protein